MYGSARTVSSSVLVHILYIAQRGGTDKQAVKESWTTKFTDKSVKLPSSNKILMIKLYIDTVYIKRRIKTKRF